MTLIYFKADEITKDPCSVCSKRIGEEVLCMTTGTPTLTRTYFPNGSISNDVLR